MYRMRCYLWINFLLSKLLKLSSKETAEIETVVELVGADSVEGELLVSRRGGGISLIRIQASGQTAVDLSGDDVAAE